MSTNTALPQLPPHDHQPRPYEGPAIADVAALRLIAHEPPVARWLNTKCKRPGAIKGKAIVALMRKLAKGLWHQGRGEPFVIDKLFEAPPMGAC